MTTQAAGWYFDDKNKIGSFQITQMEKVCLKRSQDYTGFLKPIELYNIKSELQCELQTLVNNKISIFINQL